MLCALLVPATLYGLSAADPYRWTHRLTDAHDGVPKPQRHRTPVGASAPPAANGPSARSARPDRHPDEDDGALFLVVVTAGGTVLDRVRAGQPVLLTATGMGLPTTPFSQAVKSGR